MTESNLRRIAREAALKKLNELAAAAGLDRVKTRAGGDEVVSFYENLCNHSTHAERAALEVARSQWIENGGIELPEGCLPKDEGEAENEDGGTETPFPGGEMPVDGHRRLHHNGGKKDFRLRARAFLLTFNSLAFAADPSSVWVSFVQWSKERQKKYGATYWSATMEESLESEAEGRVHLHVYFSWHAAGSSGVDHSTTDGFVFMQVRPRVDVNTEARSAWQWLKATQRGHFYVVVNKVGSLYCDSNYLPWTGRWVPDAHWCAALWRQHKLSHEEYLKLSVKLREGHLRRKADVEAVVAAEADLEYHQEQEQARR